MRTNRIVSLLGSALIIYASATFSTAFAESLPTDKGCKNIENKSSELNGWCIAVDRFKGNCLACHIMITPIGQKGFLKEGIPPRRS